MKKYIILLFPLSLVIRYFSSRSPHIVEKLYSMKFYRIVVKALTSFSKLISFSLAEVVIVFIIAAALIYIFKFLRACIINPSKRTPLIKGFLVNILSSLSIIYFLFLILWGINYYRLPFSTIAGIKGDKATSRELVSLADNLISNSNKYRSLVIEDSNGVMKLKSSKADVMKNAQRGYEEIASVYPELLGNYGTPKGIALSTPMSYTGISGVYFPFTGEANINTLTPDSLFPSTVCHEMSHQRGFAREDESNYIAYLSCINHPDNDFKYSGYLLGLIHTLGAVKSTNPDVHKQLVKKLSPGVVRDINYLSSFWGRYDGPMTVISDKINDFYLKSNKQASGVQSYGEMVNLLIWEQRKMAD